ncbi:NAD-dependent epimerase/dehydratase family protein [Streptomyces sp. NPDC051453]|uniref:NAD-dependent epimerase/dehydratase family protein n=1 Tax=Streptomyces sp. NPDC051453 TaxID=3154941 RepID=UPI003448FADE
MRILIIGGSVFLGRAFVEEAVACGHSVTVFNRGKSGPDVPGTESVRGDRENPADLKALTDRGPWDAVIDAGGQHPRTVGLSARTLSGHADAYLFVSSFHAYAPWPAGPVDEDSERHACPPDAAVGEVPSNALKAGCERALEAGFEGRTVILNPGLIVGPREVPGRLLWWLERMARGGEVLVPGGPDRPVQLIDARDIAAFGTRLLEAGGAGRFIVAGQRGTATLGELFRAIARATGARAELAWADDDFLLEQEVGPWVELPFWAPDQPAMAGVWSASTDRAVALGLNCRPMAETVADTWEWLHERGPIDTPYKQGDLPLGIDAEKEAAVLRARHARTAT